MGMEILGSDFQVDQKKGVTEGNAQVNSVEGPEETIKSVAVENKAVANGSTQGELQSAKAANFPKDAVDEWPSPKQIHSFFVVRFRPYDDPKLKVKIDQADREIQKRNQSQFQLVEAIKKKQSERSHVITQLKPLTAEDKKFRSIIDEKRKEMEPFQDALGKLRTAENARISEGICSSEEELDERLRSLNFRLNHESNTIAEEKQILKDIKFLEGTREKVIKISVIKAKIGDSYGQKKDMIGQVKQIGVNLDAIRKDQQVIRAKIKKLEEELNAIDDEIISLREELAAGDLKKNKAFEALRDLRKANNEVNAFFYQNRSVLNSVKELAAKKDIASLEELCNTETEKFMSQWCGSKKFRDDYERRILVSLDNRQLSRDGRMRNPDEKPIIVVEVPRDSEPEQAPVPVKSNTKRAKEDSHLLHHEKISSQKLNKEEPQAIKGEEKAKMGTKEEETQLSSQLGESTKESSPISEIDPVKLKELKREEELAKAKMAMERKKKLAEKVTAKAAAKAKKEAEKKLKEKEKKARKKAGTTAAEPSTVEDETEQKIEEPVEPEVDREAPLSSKREQKDTVRYRNRQKSAVQAPKPIPRRKKSSSYLMWAAPAAILAVIAAFLAYYYTLTK